MTLPSPARDKGRREYLTIASCELATPSAPPPATDLALWGGIAALAVSNALGMWWFGWRVQWGQVAALSGVVAGLCALGGFYAWSGRSLALARIPLAVAQLLALILMGQATTYLVGTTHAPFQDAAFRAADAAIGFSWDRWAAWMARHPTLSLMCDVVYLMHLPAVALTVMLLAGRAREGATPFLRACAVAFVVSVGSMATVPALGATMATTWAPVHAALRSGTFHRYDLFSTSGLISMPSFHAVLAVLIAIACWPYRRLRWPAVAFTVVMLIATPLDGAHYLVDVLAGIALALWSAQVAGLTRSVPRVPADHEAPTR